MTRKSLISMGGLAPGLLAATLLLFIVITGALVNNLMRVRESFSWVQHTNDVIAAVAGIQQAVLEAESTERGFLLTGVAAYAQDFDRSRNSLVARLDSLRALVADNPEQVASVEALRSVAAIRMTQMQAAVDLGPAKLPQALDILEQTRIEPLTERIETMLTTMIHGEQAGLMRRQEQLDGETFTAALTTALLLMLAVACAAIAAFVREHQRALSREQEADHRLQQLQAELLRVARLGTMGGMTTALAHELNQPLAAVTNYLSGSRRMLESSAHPDSLRIGSALDKAAQQALRAGAVIQRLRDFVDRGETERTAASLRAIVDDALALASVVTLDHPVEVTRDLDPSLDLVMVDKVQLQQVFLNLIRNAFEAMREQADRRLYISSLPAEDGTVEVIIADCGPGLDPSMLDRMFQPFSTTKADGMGVGLSISQTIVQAHGGVITTEPNPGGGTAFRFTLPLAEALHQRLAPSVNPHREWLQG
uniref:histidine kinase n=1 Tax=Rhodopseudomonas palustris (strain BisA53) TaxID=316055 RepID=Q07NY0_RHOP5